MRLRRFVFQRIAPLRRHYFERCILPHYFPPRAAPSARRMRGAERCATMLRYARCDALLRCRRASSLSDAGAIKELLPSDAARRKHATRAVMHMRCAVAARVPAQQTTHAALTAIMRFSLNDVDATRRRPMSYRQTHATPLLEQSSCCRLRCGAPRSRRRYGVVSTRRERAAFAIDAAAPAHARCRSSASVTRQVRAPGRRQARHAQEKMLLPRF